MCSSSGFSDLQANLASIHKPPSHSGMANTKMTTTSLYAVVFIALLSLTLTSATLQIDPGATWTGVSSSPHILPDSQHSPASRMTLSISLTLSTSPPLAPSLPSGLTPLLPAPLSSHRRRRLHRPGAVDLRRPPPLADRRRRRPRPRPRRRAAQGRAQPCYGPLRHVHAH